MDDMDNTNEMQHLELVADWHVHTHFSDGRAGPEEMVAAAARRGLAQVALTDHGPRGMFIGVRQAGVYLDLKKQAAKWSARYGIQVLVGAEANVISVAGDLDIPRAISGQLDLLVAGLHPQVWCRPPGQTLTWILPNLLGRFCPGLRARMRGTNTRALVAAIHKNRLTFVSHPNLMMLVDLDQVARACADTGCALEINTGHHYDRVPVVRAALRWGAPLVVNSDAHFPASVGNLEPGLALLRQYRVPPEQVLNLRGGGRKQGTATTCWGSRSGVKGIVNK